MKRALAVILFLVGVTAPRAEEAGETASDAVEAADATEAPKVENAEPAAETLAEAGEPAVPASAPVGLRADPTVVPAGSGKTLIYTIPVRDEIAKPVLFIIRTGVKNAIAAGARYVVLDMDTPGGGLGETLEIMEILDRFTEVTDGRVATYVNREAASAGAIIAAVTDEIYFAPKGVIGAAEVVLATGENVGESLKRKITSFLAAKVRALSEGHAYRGQVLQAMMDPGFELKIGEETIKAKDTLLTLTATEAMKEYGDPPQPLLGAGIADDLPALYEMLAGGDNYEVRRFEITWSVELAQWLTMLSPVLLSLGGLLIFIEFKTPGFGVIGIAGIVLVVIVLFGHHVAGLSGNEPMLIFVLGFVMVLVELLFFPGIIVLALLGLLLMLGSLLWGMADIWPGDAFELTPDMFLRPAVNVLAGVGLTVVLAVALTRFLPRSWIWDRLVLQGAVRGVSGSPVSGAGAAMSAGEHGESLVGARGSTVTGLYPSGTVEVGGRRVQARLEVGTAAAGTPVRVVRRSNFVYIVEIET